MKRFLALALSVLMILGVLLMAGCSDTNTPGNSTPKDTTAGTTAGTTDGSNDGTTAGTTDGTSDGSTSDNGGTVVPTGKEKMPGYEDLTFGGETFKIVGCDGVDDGFNSAKEIYSEETDAISVAVRERNLWIERLYDCKIQGVASATPAGDVSAELTGNQHTIDLYTHHYSITSVAKDNHYNLMTVGSRDIDFTQPWWDQQYVGSYTIKNSAGQNTLYSIVGDFALTTFDCTHAIVYNIGVFRNESKINSIDMYQLVRDKKWTMDVFASIIKDVAKDSNGDQTFDSQNGDVAGWIRTGHATHGLHVASGLSIIKNTDGVLTFDVDKNTETWTNVIAKANEIWALPQGQTLSYSVIPETLASGQALFASEILGSSLAKLKDFPDAEIGLLPYPLHSETQDNYAHYVDNHVYSYSIPTSCDNPDAVADFLTVYAYASRYIVRKAYIETYAYEYCSDEASAEMLDLILSTMTYDPGYLSSTPNLEADLSNMITNNKNQVAQFAARKATNANEWITKFIAEIDDNVA